MELEVLTSTGEKTGRTVALAENIFGIEPNDHAIYMNIRQYMANQRQGTHKTKERAEIKGSTKKLKKQKGTGTARAGSIKSPIFRGGGRIFGPRPRNYGFKLNKKTKALARKSVLTYKAKDNAILVVEDFNFEKPHTKDYIQFLNALGLGGKKTLFMPSEYQANIYLSGRNIPKTEIIPCYQASTYQILNADYLIVAEKALDKLSEVFKK